MTFKISGFNESPYLRKISYGVMTLAVGVTAQHYGKLNIAFTFLSAELFVQGYNIYHYSKDPAFSEKEKLDRITECIFTFGLTWGIISAGTALALLYDEGKIILQGAEAFRKLLQTPSSLPHAWLDYSPVILEHATTTLFAAAYALPEALYWVSSCDDYFYGKKVLAHAVYGICEKVLRIWQSAQNQAQDLYSQAFLLLQLYTVLNQVSALRSALSIAPASTLKIFEALKALVIQRLNPHPNKNLKTWLADSVSNSPPEKLLPVAETNRYANAFFFYTFNLPLVAARLYHHPMETGFFFLLGLLYRTPLQSEETIQRKWTVAPDFIGAPWKAKLDYIYNRISDTALTVAWWNFTAAFLNGFYLAETSRYLYRKAF